MRTKALLLVSMIMLAARPARAINTNAGTGGASFMKIGLGSARAAALGHAFTGLASGPDAMLYNPAGLAGSTQRELSFGVTNWVQDITAQSVGYVHPLGRTVLGVQTTYMSVTGFDVRDDQGIAMSGSHVRVRDAVAGASVAHSFLYEKLFLGMSVKEVYENNGGPTRSTVVQDLGALVRPNPMVAVGASFLNLSNNKKRVVQTQRLGVAVSPSSFLNLALDLFKDSDNSSRLALGAEFLLSEELLEVGQMAFRVGYYEADPQGENRDGGMVKQLSLQRTSGVTLGLGIYSTEITGYGVGLDYALVPMGALGASHQIQVQLRF